MFAILFAILQVAYCSDQVYIKHHLVISQPSAESIHLAEFIDSQNCLFNINMKSEITNYEFDHVNDGKIPKTKLIDALHARVSSDPVKVNTYLKVFADYND